MMSGMPADRFQESDHPRRRDGKFAGKPKPTQPPPAPAAAVQETESRKRQFEAELADVMVALADEDNPEGYWPLRSRVVDEATAAEVAAEAGHDPKLLDWIHRDLVYSPTESLPALLASAEIDLSDASLVCVKDFMEPLFGSGRQSRICQHLTASERHLQEAMRLLSDPEAFAAEDRVERLIDRLGGQGR